MFPTLKKYIPADASDEVLMHAIKQGKEIAFTVLYDRYHRKLFRFFLRLLNQDKAMAEDFLQDLFMKVLDASKSFDESQKVSTWLYTIATNMCRSHWRKNVNHQRLMQEFEPWENLEVKGINEGIDNGIIAIKINELLHRMKEQDREIIVLRFHQELPVKEIATIMNIPDGTVKSRIFYLLRKLSVKLKAYQQA